MIPTLRIHQALTCYTNYSYSGMVSAVSAYNYEGYAISRKNTSYRIYAISRVFYVNQTVYTI